MGLGRHGLRQRALCVGYLFGAQDPRLHRVMRGELEVRHVRRPLFGLARQPVRPVLAPLLWPRCSTRLAMACSKSHTRQPTVLPLLVEASTRPVLSITATTLLVECRSIPL